jgi:hypothetical protein
MRFASSLLNLSRAFVGEFFDEPQLWIIAVFCVWINYGLGVAGLFLTTVLMLRAYWFDGFEPEGVEALLRNIS